jgi:hypothetical protein
MHICVVLFLLALCGGLSSAAFTGNIVCDHTVTSGMGDQDRHEDGPLALFSNVSLSFDAVGENVTLSTSFFTEELSGWSKSTSELEGAFSANFYYPSVGGFFYSLSFVGAASTQSNCGKQLTALAGRLGVSASSATRTSACSFAVANAMPWCGAELAPECRASEGCTWCAATGAHKGSCRSTAEAKCMACAQ